MKTGRASSMAEFSPRVSEAYVHPQHQSKQGPSTENHGHVKNHSDRLPPFRKHLNSFPHWRDHSRNASLWSFSLLWVYWEVQRCRHGWSVGCTDNTASEECRWQMPWVGDMSLVETHQPEDEKPSALTSPRNRKYFLTKNKTKHVCVDSCAQRSPLPLPPRPRYL